MNKDFIDILREIRGNSKPGQAAKEGIWYELTQADKNGNPGIYGDILAKYGIVTDSAGTFDKAVAILENLNVEVKDLPHGSPATSELINGVWYIGIPAGRQGDIGTDGADGLTATPKLIYDEITGELKFEVSYSPIPVERYTEW